MANRRLQVFVSSRMEELATERQTVKTALNDRDVEAWVFEADAGSRSTSIQQTYRRELDDADLYVGLFWNGYGKYTLDEFTYARQQQKHCLIYEKREDIEGKRDPMLQKFLDDLGDVTAGVTSRRFNTTGELAGFVKQDVAAWQADIVHRLLQPGSSAPFHAPPLSDTYVPRETLLAQLKGMLLAGQSETRRITRAALHGTGGAGKSAAAAMFAHDADVASSFPHGTLWADVGQQPDLVGILSSWGRALRDEDMPASGYPSQQAGTKQLRTLLKNRACLLVLDDVWHAESVREAFLVGGPRCLLLATTRIAQVAVGIRAQQIDIPEMNEPEAVALLARWTGALNAADEEAARRVAKQLGYLPLALELAGARIARLKDWDEYQKRWNAQQLDALTRGRGASGKDDNLNDSIELSLQALSNEDRQAYLRLAIFPKGIAFPATSAAALLGSSEPDASDFLLDIVGQALLKRQPSALGVRFRLHDVLHDFSTARLGKAGAALAHAALVEGYRKACDGRWAAARDDGYCFEHIAHHLVAAGQSSELYRLIDKPWMDAKRRLTHSHRLFYQDVELAVEQAAIEDPPNLVQLVRGCLIQNTLASVAGSIPPALIEVLAADGQIERARGYAALIPDTGLRCQALMSIAHAPLAKENGQAAKDDLKMIVSLVVDNKDANERQRMLDSAISALMPLASPAEILQWVPEQARRVVIERMVERSIASDDPAAAAFSTRLASMPYPELVPLLLHLGQFDRALEMVRSQPASTPGLLAVARALIDAGELARAAALAEVEPTLWTSWNSEFAFPTAFARGLARTGDTSSIVDLISRIENNARRRDVLTRTVAELVKNGDPTRAEEVANRHDDAAEREFALYAFVGALVNAGAVDAAWDIAKSMRGAWRAAASAHVAKAKAVAGDGTASGEAADDALAHLDRLESDYSRAITLGWTAQALARAGRAQDGRAAANRALTLCGGIGRELTVLVVQEASAALTDVGDYDQARDAIFRLDGGWHRDKLIRAHGAALVAAREFGRAADLVNLLKSEHDRLEFLKSVAPLLLEAGAYDALRAALERIAEGYYRDEAITPVMESLIERRECRRALAWVELMSSHRRDTLLRKLIEPMVASGDGKELLEAVHAMDLHGLAWEVIGRTTKQRVRDGVFDEYWRADGIDIPDDRRSELQLEVVRALIEIGALERALTAAKSNHGRARLDALAETAVAFAAADRVNEALEIVALLDYDPRRETTRSAIVSTLVERKQFERALDLALRLGDKMFQKSDLLESIFDRLLELGAYEKARAAADAIPRAGLRTSLLASLALAISRHGRLAQGMALADELLGNLEAAVPTATLDHFFQRAAETLAANSQGGAATLTGMRIGDEKERRKPLRTRVALALQAGDIEGPLREVDALPAEPYSSHWIRAETRADIAAYLSAHGPREKALEVTRSACADLVAVVKLQDPLLIGLNTEAHKLLAKSWQLLAGRGAFQTVDELIAAVRAAEVAEDSVLALLAALLAEHGEVAWGIAVAEAIQDRGDRAEAFVGMAESLQRRGDGSVRDVAQRALSEATQLGGWRRAEMLGLVAAVSIRSGDRSTWKQTLSFGDDRNATENVAVVASHAALALMDSGAAAEAIELARAHVSSATRASLCRLVLVLARGGCADDARAVTRSWRFDGADHLDRAAMLGEISALVGSAREAVTALHDIGDPATFRRVLRLVVQRNPPGTHTADVMRFWSEAVRGLERSTARATMLARIALELDATELRVHAAGVLTTALLESRNSDRGTVLEVVATGAPILARMDEGRLLNRILDEVTLVDSWWQTGPPPPSGATAMLAV